jgi:PAS domain S-box-containing protein
LERPQTAVPEREAARLAALLRLEVLDTSEEEAFDGIVRMAAKLCAAPIAAISLVDASRVWFKARAGLAVREVPRARAFCSESIGLSAQDLLIIRDAAADPRFAGHPLVAGEAGVRFYAGTPLVTRDGQALGALCVMDRGPRDLGGDQAEALAALAEQVIADLELRASRSRFAARYRNALLTTAPGQGDRAMAERLHAAIEQLRESIVLTDAADRFVITNRTFRELNRNIPHAIQPGQTFEDYMRAGLAAGNYPDAIGREQEWLAARLAERRNPGPPVERQRPGGRWFLIDDRRLPDGSTIRFGTEITDRKRAEADLNERNRDLQLVIDSVPVMITRLDKDERFLFANRAYTDLMEIAVENIIGRRIAEVVAPDVYAQIRPALDRALSGDQVSVERIQRRSNGELVALEGRYVPDVDAEGRVIGLIAVHRDVTAERRARESLARSEARFRSLTALTSDWYWEQDAQFRYVFISEDADARGALGMKARAGKTRWELPWTGVSDAQWAAHRAQLEAHQVFHDFEIQRPGPDGAPVWVSVSGEPILDSQGRFAGYRGLTRNITARKAAEQSLRLEHQVTRALSDAEDAASGVKAVLRVVCETVGMGCGRFFKLDEAAGVLRFHDGWCLPQATYERFLENSRQLVFRPGEGLAGIIWQTGEPIWSSDTSRDTRVLGKSLAQNSDIRNAFAFGVSSEGKIIGVLSFSGTTVREPDERLLQAARVIGSQIGQFLKRKQAEESLRDREQMFDALLRNMPGDVYRCRNDHDWTMEYVSEGVLELTGFPPSAFTIERRVTYDSLVHPEDRDRIWQEAQAALAERRPYTIEYRIRDTNGNEKWVWERGSGDYAADGSVLALDGFVVDMTARKRAEEALRSQTERLQIGQAAARLIVMDRDIAKDHLTWSDSPEWLRGPLPASGKYPLFKDQVHPEDRARFLASRDSAIDSIQGGSLEFRIVRTDGKVLWLLSRQKVFADANGKAVRMLAALLDITERKRAEQALAASEARFRAIFERASAGMAITDTDGTYLSVNAAFARFFGYSVDEIVGKMKVSNLRSAEDAEGAELYRQLVSGEIGFFERERQYQRKDGAQIWGHATVSAVRDADGKASYVVAVFSDITEKVLARARIERMNAELEERVETRTAELSAAVKELDAFTYSVSHDLRAPVGAVSGFAHLLRGAEAARLSADGLRLLDFIEHNAERMTRLIEGLLRFSRLGRSSLHRTRVSMNGLAGESLLDFVDDAARARIDAGAMPDCEGDPALLSQVWSNLIGNALKYSRNADAPCIDIGWDASRNAYYVRDNGVGFDMAYAGKLFGVFERLHHESEFEGSGIGLAIAERIIRLHGGAIWADAAPGRGATFWFKVPP